MVEDEDEVTKSEEGYGEGKSGYDSTRLVNVRGECYCAFILISSPHVCVIFYLPLYIH